MRRTTRAVWLLSQLSAVVLLLAFIPARADVAQAMGYLAAQQNADGSYGGTLTDIATPLQATSEALRAFQVTDTNVPPYVPALAYLNATTDNNTEFLARKIIVNAGHGADVSAFVGELLLRQDPISGGFGDTDAAPNVLDTALALQALAAAGYGSSSEVSGAVGYLLSSQEASGGFHGGDNPASVYLTALAMHALWHYRHQGGSVGNALSAARNFLLGQRNQQTALWAEGHESALALVVLVPHLPDLTLVSESLDALRARQLPNGGWDDDAYTTALAVRALIVAAAPRTNPDLVILRGKVVDAQTGLPLSGVSAEATGATNATIFTDASGQFQFNGLLAGQYTLNLSFAGYARVTASVQPGIGETTDFGTILMVKQLDSDTGTIFGKVVDGETGAALSGVMITTSSVSNPVYTDAQGMYQVASVQPGTALISATLDGYAYSSASLEIGAGVMTVFSPSLLKGTSGSPAGNAVVQGVVTDALSGVPLAGVTITAGTAVAITDATGSYRIESVPFGEVSLRAALSGYDSVIGAAMALGGSIVSFSPKLYAQGTSPPFANTSGITGLVRDAGSGAPLSGVNIVAVFNGQSQTITTNEAGRFTIEGLIAAQGTLSASSSNYAPTEIAVVLEPLRLLDMGEVRLRPGQAQNLLPDIVVESVDRIATTTDLQTLQITGHLSAHLKNKGYAPVATNIRAIAFFDTNRNGTYDSEIDTTVGEAETADMLVVDGMQAVDIPVAGALPFRDAPLSVWVDSSQAAIEVREDNNIGTTASACEVKPPVGKFEPVLKWAWTGSAVMPNHRHVSTPPIVAQTNDDNGDGRIDGDDDADIIFPAFWNDPYGANAILRIISGKDGSDLVTVTDPAHRVHWYTTFAVADLDGDGLIEIVGSKLKGGVIAFNHDGTLKWQNTSADVLYGTQLIGAPSIVDLDGDGRPEILYGRTVLNYDGTVRWIGAGTYTGGVLLSIAADINLSGRPEIIVGASAYDYQGKLLWRNDVVGDGFAAVGNFNDDPYPEIVVVGGTATDAKKGEVYLLDHLGNVVWGPVLLPGGGHGGPPTIADMDGDGMPEIGIAGASRYVVLRSDGSILWTSVTQDQSSHVTGSSVFDFDGDGKAEVIYADEVRLRVYEGATGKVLISLSHSSGTGIEYPVIVDLDKDNHADLLVASNHFYGSSASNGIRVFKDKNDSWVNTRRIWNQHSYHITNINDDGTVPQVEQNSWQVHNTYRLNTQPGVSSTAAPDLTASYLRLQDRGGLDSSTFTVRVGNGGGLPAGKGVAVAFYNGDPATGGVLLGTATTTKILEAGEFEDVSLAYVPPLSAIPSLVVVVDDNGAGQGALLECDELNNKASLALSALPASFSIAASTDQTTYGPNADVHITAPVTNSGSFSGTALVGLTIESLEGVRVIVLPPVTVEVSALSTASVTAIWNTGTIFTGDYRVKVELLDADGRPYSAAFAPFAVIAPPTPALTLRTTTDRPAYHTTDTVNIGNLVSNISPNVIIDDAYLRVMVFDPTGTGVFVQNVPLTQLLPNALRDLPVPLFLQGAAMAVYQVKAAVIQNATQEVLATAETHYEVRFDFAKALTGQVAVGLPELEVGQTQNCIDSLTNGGNIAIADLPVRYTLINIDGEQEIGSKPASVNLASGETTSATRTFGTKDFAPGHYACVLQAHIAGADHTLAYGTFLLKPPPIKATSALTRGAKGRLLVLLDGGRKPDDGTCTGVTGLGMELPFASPLSATASVEVRVRDAAGVLLETESVTLADFLLTVNATSAQAGSDLAITEFTANHLVAKLTATEALLGSDYSVEAVIQDGGVATTYTSTPVHTGCAQSIAERQWHGDFVIHELDLVEPLLPPQDRDPHGPDGAPGLDAQRAYLEALLARAGWSYTIAVTAEEFTREMRTGAYNLYASFAEHEKLSVEAQKELREAVFRGEGLLLAGPHDSRHHHLIETLGVKYRGQVSFADGVGFIDDTFGPVGGTGLIPGDAALRIERTTASSVAQFLMMYDDNEHLCAGDDQYAANQLGKPAPGVDRCATLMDAVTLNPYGAGRTVFAGFDLLATATLQGHDGLLAQALLAGLEYVNPPIADNTVGRVAPITLTVTNQGIATPIRATLPLPTGLQVIDPRGGTVLNDTVIWQGELAVDAVKTYTVYVRLPETAGAVTFQAQVEAPKAGVYTVITESTFTLQVEPTPDPDILLVQLSALQGAGLPEDRFYKQADTYLRKARDLVAAQNFDHALWEAIKAADALASASSMEVMPVRVGLGHWIAWIERRVP